MEAIELSEVAELKLIVSDDVSGVELAEWITTADPNEMDVLMSSSAAGGIKRSFPLNSKLREITDAHATTLYAIQKESLPTIAIDNERAYYHLCIGGLKEFVALSEDGFHSAITSEFNSLVKSASGVDIQVPAWSSLLEELEHIVGLEARSAFEELIQAANIENVPSLDAISVALVAAAQSGAMLYDLCEWAEETGVASKATISRRKTALEDRGIIDTEKVPVDVGRPRQRLLLSDGINAVHIDTAEIEVSKITSPQFQSESDNSSNVSKPEQSDQQQTHNQDEIISIIEKEVQDVISSN